MSAVLSPQRRRRPTSARASRSRSSCRRVTNKIHATNNIDEIMLEVSADVCALFNADRLTIYSMGEDKQSIVSKVKTGLNSFKDLKLPIAEHSIAGYVALAKKTANIKDVYDENELRALNANLRFLQEVDKRTGYRTKQMLVAPILEAGSNELIGVIQIINNKAGVPFGALAEEGVERAVADPRHRLQAAPEAAGRQDQVRLPDRRRGALGRRVRARRAPGAQEGDRHRAGADRRVPGQDPGDRRRRSPSSSACPTSRSSPTASSRRTC